MTPPDRVTDRTTEIGTLPSLVIPLVHDPSHSRRINLTMTLMGRITARVITLESLHIEAVVAMVGVSEERSGNISYIRTSDC